MSEKRSGRGADGVGTLGRRQVLAVLGTGLTGGLAGCQGVAAPRAASDGEDGQRTTVSGNLSYAETGLPRDICEEDISEDPGIYAVLDPAFDEDWSGHDVDDVYGGGLAGDHVVIGLDVDGERRAYPLSVLYLHEIVNDVVGGSPLMVTYCPLCRSGLVASRDLDVGVTEFLVSGLLWQPERIQVAASEQREDVFGADRSNPDASVRQEGNLVMYDRATRSYWSQIVARAICGPMNGTRLEILPSSVTTWGEWRRAHPDTRVLLPPPASGVAPPGGE